MKSSALSALAALTLITSAGTARAGSPYPDSTVITGVDWDRSSYRSAGDGGDIWATASASDGNVYAVTNLQDAAWPNNGVGVWRSTNKGGAWSKPSWKFSGADLRPVGFVHFGASG